jgi:Family of unknown function (DUF6444)
MSAEPQPSYEELAAENTALKSDIAELRVAFLAQQERVAELEARLNQNSKNSSRPPSSWSRSTSRPHAVAVAGTWPVRCSPGWCGGRYSTFPRSRCRSPSTKSSRAAARAGR